MKPIPRLRATTRGFSLVELMVAMAISVTLMMAMASIFTSSINTREKIDREGQKIETARYSLDTLAEDIRLAGYYGNYAPPFTGSVPADWKYVDPCSTAGGNPLPGWNATSSPIQVPFPIFGYEAHNTGSLPTALTDCLDNYKADTDVFVIRRASTLSVTAGGTGYTAADTYLQVSSCPDGTVDTQPFHAMATATSTDFNLHVLGCTSTTPGSTALVHKLITRIYYISVCDDCVNDLDNNIATTGDGIPTLKMVELAIPSTGGTTLRVLQNLRTIAPGVENLHLEYGIDTTDDGSIDAWVTSNEDPRQTASTGTAVTGMRLDASTENRWEDVMAVKLFLLTRDLKTTSNWIDSKSYTLGNKTVTAAGDGYRRRVTSSTIKLVNMSGRREVP